MRRLMLLLALISAPAFADSFADRMREANTLLGNGDFEGAMAIYQDLKIDDPESERIAHNMGLAKFRYATGLLESNNPKDALTALEEATGLFDKSMETGIDEIIETSEFAAANTTLKTADAHKAMNAYQQAIESYQLAISQYEDILRRDSGHAGAKQNRALARLRLKELMRDTPPEEQEQEQQQQQGQDENQQQEGGGESQEGEQDQQPQDSGESEGESEQGGEQDQQSQDGGQNEMDEGEPGDPSKSPEEQDQEFDLEDLKDAEGEQPPPTPGSANEDDTEANRPTEMPSQQSIEALLQSLEQMDNRLQHDARRSNERSSRPRRWW